MFLDNKLLKSDARHVNALTFILTVVSTGQKSSGLLFTLNSGVLLQENCDVIPETEYGAPISICHSLDNTKKRNFNYVRSKQNQ